MDLNTERNAESFVIDDWTKYLTRCEEATIDDLTLALLDGSTDNNTLARHIEHVAEIMLCTPAQLIAGYVRDALRAFKVIPDSDETESMGLSLEEAHQQLHLAREEGYTPRISFS